MRFSRSFGLEIFIFLLSICGILSKPVDVEDQSFIIITEGPPPESTDYNFNNDLSNDLLDGSEVDPTTNTYGDKVFYRNLDEESQKPPGKPEIYWFRIESNIRYRYASTYVTSRVANRDTVNAHEVSFSVVLPETAFISKFIMEIDGKSYEAYVKPKEEAKDIYDQAISQGQSAGIVELNKRHSNVFNVNVNIQASSKVNFNLTYEELLSRRLGRYEQAIDINLEQVSQVKDFEVVVNLEESQNLTKLFVPKYLASSNENSIANYLAEENKDVVIERDQNKAKISWKPSQEQLAELLAKDKEGLGKFTVQYDIQRNDGNGGEILLMNGYFVHFFAPTYLKPLRKHVVFILDISGSMWGRKLVQMKEAMNKILADLSSEDFFNIILFSSDVKRWTPDDKIKKAGTYTSAWSRPGIYHGESQTPVVKINPDEPYPATKENVEKAQKYINDIEANGGTNIHDAIINALNLTIEIRNTSATHHEQQSTTTTTMKPAETTISPTSSEEIDETTLSYQEFVNKTKAILAAKKNETNTNTTTLTKPKVILPKNVESLIMFLTDGEPTVGHTDPTQIQTLILAANKNSSIPIFSLAFGEGADFPFVKKISLQNNGFARKIYEASDAALQLKGFYNELASPLLSNVTFNYTTNSNYTISNLTLTKFQTVFGGTEIAVSGKITKNSYDTSYEISSEDQDDSQEENSHQNLLFKPVDLENVDDDEKIIDVTIRCFGYDGPLKFNTHELFTSGDHELSVRPYPPRPTPPPTKEDVFLERLWAYLTIQQLLEKDLASVKSIDETKVAFDKVKIRPSTAIYTSTTPTSTILSSTEKTVENSTSPAVNETKIATPQKVESPKEQALRLALKYGFVTSLTSLVVVKPNNTNETRNAVSVDDKPIALPGGHHANRIVASSPQALAFMATRAPLPIPISATTGLQYGNSYGHKITPHLGQHSSLNSYAPLIAGGYIAGGRPGPGGFAQGSQIHPVNFGSNEESVDYGEPVSVDLSPEEQHEYTARPIYSLKQVKWLQTSRPDGLVDKILVPGNNGTEVETIIAKKDETVENPEKCQISSNNQNSTHLEGSCLHLKDCVQEDFIQDFELYKSKFFCPIQVSSISTFAGVCCPKP